MSNPANIGKYQSDPDVMNVINKAGGVVATLRQQAMRRQVMGAFSKFGCHLGHPYSRRAR